MDLRISIKSKNYESLLELSVSNTSANLLLVDVLSINSTLVFK